MTAFSLPQEAHQALILVQGYSFDLSGRPANDWLDDWLRTARPAWVRDGVIEALYEGRYKAVSVRQILQLWNRRGEPVRHFNREFVRIACRQFDEIQLVTLPSEAPARGNQPIEPLSPQPNPKAEVSAGSASYRPIYSLHRPIQPFKPELTPVSASLWTARRTKMRALAAR
ncbi:hypothetical protein IQ241_12920 [Romeria aff. gracilis LEGE 07310]|uniref:Uncharacterized protein n=1 Tax=Vasconcelosia minhoensis LEGE 07310 TaxID=915328 RepID=A0A8J7AW51_9CYAN|nr:hypothetical protein [Romeria gracilis]MBE9078183.1 hypothetical protein [Romeria aff. gracilis LEGE 07310]